MANTYITIFRLIFQRRDCFNSAKTTPIGTRGIPLITYDKLWITMKKKNISQYKLINEYHISAGQLSRLRKNAHVSTHTLDTLCNILDCRIEDIMTFHKT